jgi:hypothetical protein
MLFTGKEKHSDRGSGHAVSTRCSVTAAEDRHCRRRRRVRGRTIDERLRGKIWRELTKDEAISSRYLSREFVTADADGKKRSVSDFSPLTPA